MTDGLDQALVNAGLALLYADANLAVYDGQVPPNTAPPYVVVYATVGRPIDGDANPLSGTSATYLARWYTHSIGATAQASRAVAQRVRTALLDVRPVVTGLSCGLIRQDAGDTPPQRDESTGALVMDTVQTYSLIAS